jgi:hypothetical protein
LYPFGFSKLVEHDEVYFRVVRIEGKPLSMGNCSRTGDCTDDPKANEISESVAGRDADYLRDCQRACDSAGELWSKIKKGTASGSMPFYL